ncbi:MAG: hypothetical protein V4664_02345 [Patescibacteria group bacterium]
MDIKFKGKIESLIAEIKSRYDLRFIDIGLEKGAKFYIFGGVLRDMILDKPWKEIDVRVFINEPYPKRDDVMEQILSEAGINISSKIPFGESFTVYRFVPPNSKSKVDIDLSVISKDFSVGPDFTINGLYLDFVTHELIDPHNAIQAIEEKVIKTALEPIQQFKNEPWMIFRAVKAACQFDFNIEQKTLQGMKVNASLAEGMMQSIVDKSMGGMTEWLLGNMLRGLKYNAKKFVDIWNETGITLIFVKFIAKNYGSTSNDIKITNPFVLGRHDGFEDNLNIFFSEVSVAVDKENPEKVFRKILDLFEIDKPKQFEDFIIDPSKLRFIKNIDILV